MTKRIPWFFWAPNKLKIIYSETTRKIELALIPSQKTQKSKPKYPELFTNSRFTYYANNYTYHKCA